MIDLKSMFPKGSKSFFSANAPLSVPSVHTSDAVQANVAPRRGKMNGVEAEFAMRLEAMKRAGEILRYEFEGITLRFANVKYTPDFFVVESRRDALAEAIEIGKPCTTRAFYRYKFIEVKGPWIKGNRERAVERFRHAKTFWPEFTFELHQKTKDGWKQII